MNLPNNEWLIHRVPDSLFHDVRYLARQEGQSVSDYLLNLIQRMVLEMQTDEDPYEFSRENWDKEEPDFDDDYDAEDEDEDDDYDAYDRYDIDEIPVPRLPYSRWDLQA